jgi:hypothetical protein
MKRVAFFHGLESAPRSEKNDALERIYTHIYAPSMDYTDPKLFDTVLAEVKKQKIDLLIGSSMGGWFAYCISTLTGIPTLLFNPAVQGRSMEPKVKMGSIPAAHTVVLGKKDTVINPEKTISWFDRNGVGTPYYNWESMEHRIPIDVFMRWIKSPIPANRVVESFDIWMMLNEMEIPSGRWIDFDLSKVDDDGMKQIWSMYTNTYAKQGMDFSADDYREMQTKYKATFLKDVDRDSLPDAFIIYKETRYGNKIALLGTNDKKEAKRDLIQQLMKLVNTRGWFIEASLRMEEILAASGAPVVDDETVIRDIVGIDKKPEMEKKGYYTRLLSKASKRIRKRIYGITK